MKKYWLNFFGVSGVALSLLAIFLRLYKLASPSYWMDEGFSITIAQAIVDKGYPLLDSGELIWRSPLYHFFLATVMTLAGNGELATRLLSAVIGIVTIFILTYGAWRWFGHRVAYITFVLASFSTWEIAWSRQARMYILLQALFWLAAIVFQQWYCNRHRVFFWLIPLAVLAALLTHEFAFLLFIVLPAYVVIDRFLMPHWSKRFTPFFGYCCGILFILIVLILVIRFGFEQPVPVNYWSHYIIFLVREHLVLLLMAFVGILVAQRRDIPIILFLGTTGLVGLGVFSFAITLLHYRYLFFLYPVLLWLAAYGIAWVLSLRKKWISITLVTIISIALILHEEITLLPRSFYTLESDPKVSFLAYKSFTPQPDFRAAYAAIAKQNPSMVITPYPELSRLYMQRDDEYALYLDVIGSADRPPMPHHRYTGTPYITLESLERARELQAVVLLDELAQGRVDSDLLQVIEQHAEIVFEKRDGEWSRVTVYQFR